MKSINLISNLGEDSKQEDLFVFNHVVAWSLRKAFKKKGVEGNLVRDHDLLTKSPPKADHTLVISGIAMYYVAGTHRFVRGKTPTVRSRIRKTSKGKIAVYIDADYPQWFKHFDHVFTVVKPRKHPKCVYAGWGADPELFYPDQGKRALFLDSLRYGVYNNKFNHIYDVYKEALPKTGIKTYNPVPIKGQSKRIPWSEYQNMMRKCHFYCCTQLGESGLTRIEAATCGALLVVPRPLYMPRTMASLEHRIWNTKADLVKILNTKTDPKAISKKALLHSWDKVASRILKTLYT